MCPPATKFNVCAPVAATGRTPARWRPRARAHSEVRLTKPARTNRLVHEPSPYLRQHAHNPVDWYPWGEEALARARGEDKPIFLSIGYAACHWCHVMERESFEDAATAARAQRRLRADQGGPRGAARTWTPST